MRRTYQRHRYRMTWKTKVVIAALLPLVVCIVTAILVGEYQ